MGLCVNRFCRRFKSARAQQGCWAPEGGLVVVVRGAVAVVHEVQNRRNERQNDRAFDALHVVASFLINIIIITQGVCQVATRFKMSFVVQYAQHTHKKGEDNDPQFCAFSRQSVR